MWCCPIIVCWMASKNRRVARGRSAPRSVASARRMRTKRHATASAWVTSTRPDYLRQRLERALEMKNRELGYFGQSPLALDDLTAQALAWGEALGPRIVDTLPMVQEAVQTGQEVLLEGQLGVMRDLDWGIYPYVTSSNPIAGYGAVGAGLPPTAINRVIGVVKAYSTAVGVGPFPVELSDGDGVQLRDVGQEYGATTGRPRAVVAGSMVWRSNTQRGSTASPVWRSPSWTCWTTSRN